MNFRFADVKSFIDKHQEAIGDEREVVLERATEERKNGKGEIPEKSVAFIFQFDNEITERFFKEHGHRVAWIAAGANAGITPPQGNKGRRTILIDYFQNLS